MNNNIEKWRAEIDAIDDELWNRLTIVGCGLVGGSFRGGSEAQWWCVQKHRWVGYRRPGTSEGNPTQMKLIEQIFNEAHCLSKTDKEA